MSSLFRDEVLANQTDRLYGEVVLGQPFSSRLVTALITGVMIAAMAFMFLGQYSRIETAKGILVPAGQSSKVYALRSGVVNVLLVKEGQAVTVGEKLVEVMADQPSGNGERYTEEGVAAIGAQEGLAQERIALAGTRTETERVRLTASLNGLLKQRANLAEQLMLQRQMVASSRNLYEQLSPVIEKGFVSKVEVERRRQAYIAAQQQEAQLRTQLDDTDTQIAQVRAQITALPVEQRGLVVDARTALAGYGQQRARLESERAYSVTAPISGKVTALQTGLGKAAGGQVPILTILADNAQIEADVYIASRAIGFIKLNQEVRLLYDAFPYQRFGSFKGTITSVSRVIIAPNELDAPLKIEEPVYKVKVRLDRQTVEAFGDKLPVQSGMTLTANIVLERLSFWDWLMTPVRAVTKRAS